jgi:high-affinity nickel permease
MEDLQDKAEQFLINLGFDEKSEIELIGILADFGEELIANHKNELFRMYLRPFLNKEGLIEPHLVDILIDRYNEEFEIETKPEQ